MKTNPNDPIKPIQQQTEYLFGGLTKREYFAGIAMQGLISNSYHETGVSILTHAREAVKLADALINELNKEESGE